MAVSDCEGVQAYLGLFADELALRQPTPGYMRPLKESVLQIWKARKAAIRKELDRVERAAKDLWVQASLEQRQRESRSTEIGSLEPAQPHPLSAACGKTRAGK